MKFLKKNTNKTVDLKIAVNFAYNTAYQILTILIPLLTTPYLSRVLHADGIGQYSYSYAIAYYFVLFLDYYTSNVQNALYSSLI